jgi:hypothetical protein
MSLIHVILTATDNESGVDHTFYKIDSGVWSEYSLPVEISVDGGHMVTYYSIDVTGNVESIKTANLSIDHTPPDITITKQDVSFFEILFIAQVSDVMSGIDRVEFSIDGQLQYNDTQSPYEWTWTGFGDYTVTATAYDLAGNSKSQAMSTPYDLHILKNSVQQQLQGLMMT